VTPSSPRVSHAARTEGAVVGSVKVRRNPRLFTGTQPASSTTSNAARGKPAALEQGRKVYRMTMVIQNLGAEIKRELTCLPLKEEGAEHGRTKEQTE